jgi:tetratricopeptide (TPR) repeat protein
MKKATFSTFFFAVTFVLPGFSQNLNVDSLRRELAISKNDSSRVPIMSELSFAYGFRISGDSAIGYADRAIELARQNNFTRGEVRGLFSKSGILETKGDLPEALKLGFDALNISRKHNFLLETSMCLTQIANVFYDLNDFPKAISFYREATVINKEIEGQEGTQYWKYQTEVNLGTAALQSSSFKFGSDRH